MQANSCPLLIYIDEQEKRNKLNGTFSPVGIIVTLYWHFIHRHYNILQCNAENVWHVYFMKRFQGVLSVSFVLFTFYMSIEYYSRKHAKLTNIVIRACKSITEIMTLLKKCSSQTCLCFDRLRGNS